MEERENGSKNPRVNLRWSATGRKQVEHLRDKLKIVRYQG